jgi:DsbC/DsbD-like thiol-disulfide interchange protein
MNRSTLRPRRPSQLILIRLFLLISLCSLTALAACSKFTNKSQVGSSPSTAPSSEAKRIASADVIRTAVQPTEINAGGSGDAIVRLTIQNGYHINANPPTYPYLKATELEIPPSQGISVDFVYYPAPLQRKFEFAEKPLAVYEGAIELKARLKADKATKKGEQSIPARLRIQACDEQVCYPPGTINLTIPVSIK